MSTVSCRSRGPVQFQYGQVPTLPKVSSLTTIDSGRKIPTFMSAKRCMLGGVERLVDKRSWRRRDAAFWLLGVIACNQPTPERNESVAESLQGSTPALTQAVAPRATPRTGLEALEPWRERIPLHASDDRCSTTLAETG